MREMEKSGTQPGPEMQKKILVLANELMKLSPAQLRLFIAGVRDADGLDDEMREGIAGFAILNLAESSPRQALDLFTESSDLLGNMDVGSHVISSALSRLAMEDPMAALEWARRNEGKHPDIVTDRARQGILDGVAKRDPALAFQLLGELGLENPSSGVTSIMMAAGNPESRSAAVDALRDYVADLPEGERRSARQNAFGSLVNAMREENFETSATWLADMDLAPEEAEAFAGRLNYHNTRESSGKWIGWMADELPPEKVGERVGNIMGEWTRQDYRAAGTWLAQAPDDAAKVPAVRSYAETVAGYEPLTAEQWALTLPPGEDREATLKSIHERWPDDDTEGREEFAGRYGIE